MRFFEKTFLLADISMEAILRIFFLLLSDVDICFLKTSELTWRNCAAIQALSSIKRVKLIDRKEFAKAILDENAKTFVIHAVASSALLIDPSQYV